MQTYNKPADFHSFELLCRLQSIDTDITRLLYSLVIILVKTIEQ